MTQRRFAVIIAVFLVCIVVPAGLTAVIHAQTPAFETYNWEEYGISFKKPQDWQIANANQTFDLAVISPDAATQRGAYLMWQYFATLGGDSFEEALQPIAEQVGGEVQSYTVGEQEGAAVITNREEEMDDGETVTFTEYLILIPYGTGGETFYIQGIATTPDEQSTLEAIIDSITINPPRPDYDAVDAAWQQNLAENGTLTYGPEDAPLRVYEVMSFTCGHCINYSFDVSRLMALEAEPGNIQMTIGSLASQNQEGTYAPTLATYCAAEQGKGYSTYTALIRGYLEQGASVYTPDGAREIVDNAFDLDMEQYDACVAGDTYLDQMTSVREFANQVELTGTPSMLFATADEGFQFLQLPTGEKWSGIIPLGTLRSIIDMIVNEGMPIADVLGTPETSADTSEAETGSQDQNVAMQNTTAPDSTADEAANDSAGAPADTTAEAADETEDDTTDISPTLVVVGIAILLGLGIGLVMLSRRKDAPLVADPAVPAEKPVSMVQEPDEQSHPDEDPTGGKTRD